MYRHLEENPEYQFYPLFRMFESWCQDENRHDDIFKALLRLQPKMWQGWQARLWARFFLLSVFATHTLTVYERGDFYAVVGLDAEKYDREVIRKTNETAARAFPVNLNVEHPQFFARLEKCADRNEKIKGIGESKAPKAVKLFRKLPLIAGIFIDLLRLYLLKPNDAESLRGTVR